MKQAKEVMDILCKGSCLFDTPCLLPLLVPNFAAPQTNSKPLICTVKEIRQWTDYYDNHWFYHNLLFWMNLKDSEYYIEDLDMTTGGR